MPVRGIIRVRKRKSGSDLQRYGAVEVGLDRELELVGKGPPKDVVPMDPVVRQTPSPTT